MARQIVLCPLWLSAKREHWYLAVDCGDLVVVAGNGGYQAEEVLEFTPQGARLRPSQTNRSDARAQSGSARMSFGSPRPVLARERNDRARLVSAENGHRTPFYLTQ